MGYRFVDLTLVMDPKDTYVQFPRDEIYGKPAPGTTITPIATLDVDHIANFRFETTTQSYTHYDAPAHFYHDGLKNHEVPLDHLCGEACVIKIPGKGPSDTVSAKDLEAAGVGVRPGDIAIVSTEWTDRAWGSRDFWEHMIYLTTDAADWLIGKGIKALVQDFMTCDSPLYPPPERKWPAPDWSPNHIKFLSRGICLIEWCTNIGAIRKERVLLVTGALKLKDTEGAPARVIAIEEVEGSPSREGLPPLPPLENPYKDRGAWAKGGGARRAAGA
ncbi:MAG: cyclase family protein [Candidatus Tectomicrobia bacterium]|uniref:Cyclase family protein n=1 Tax=Tectimicrobiota bacterium TaxID=2528274 RepID=A0A932MP71_UNCTE|nr:cyclase family protein [Candidatus Tectomicrobia bacterium]